MLPSPPRPTLFPYTTLFRSVDEADHVPRNAPLPDLDQPLVPPVRQRLGPRQGEQPGRVVGGGREDELHKTIFTPNGVDRKSTRLNSSHVEISYAVFCLKKKK